MEIPEIGLHIIHHISREAVTQVTKSLGEGGGGCAAAMMTLTAVITDSRSNLLSMSRLASILSPGSPCQWIFADGKYPKAEPLNPSTHATLIFSKLIIFCNVKGSVDMFLEVTFRIYTKQFYGGCSGNIRNTPKIGEHHHELQMNNSDWTHFNKSINWKMTDASLTISVKLIH